MLLIVFMVSCDKLRFFDQLSIEMLLFKVGNWSNRCCCCCCCNRIIIKLTHPSTTSTAFSIAKDRMLHALSN